MLLQQSNDLIGGEKVNLRTGSSLHSLPATIDSREIDVTTSRLRCGNDLQFGEQSYLLSISHEADQVRPGIFKSKPPIDLGVGRGYSRLQSDQQHKK